jgi:hypothetical protein
MGGGEATIKGWGEQFGDALDTMGVADSLQEAVAANVGQQQRAASIAPDMRDPKRRQLSNRGILSTAASRNDGVLGG